MEGASYLGLTTVRQQLELSGAWGAQRLLELTDGWGPRDPVVEKLSLELVERRTTAEPAR
jgi:DNA-binding LacI/PurR family transcriptional regulator